MPREQGGSVPEGDWFVPEGDERKVEESADRLDAMVERATAYLVRCGSCGFVGGPEEGMCARCGYDGVDPASDGGQWIRLTDIRERLLGDEAVEAAWGSLPAGSKNVKGLTWRDEYRAWVNLALDTLTPKDGDRG